MVEYKTILEASLPTSRVLNAEYLLQPYASALMLEQQAGVRVDAVVLLFVRREAEGGGPVAYGAAQTMAELDLSPPFQTLRNRLLYGPHASDARTLFFDGRLLLSLSDGMRRCGLSAAGSELFPRATAGRGVDARNMLDVEGRVRGGRATSWWARGQRGEMNAIVASPWLAALDPPADALEPLRFEGAGDMGGVVAAVYATRGDGARIRGRAMPQSSRPVVTLAVNARAVFREGKEPRTLERRAYPKEPDKDYKKLRRNFCDRVEDAAKALEASFNPTFVVNEHALAYHLRNMRIFLDNDGVSEVVPAEPSATRLVEIIRALHRLCNCLVMLARDRNTGALLHLALRKRKTSAAALQARFDHNSQRAYWQKPLLEWIQTKDGTQPGGASNVLYYASYQVERRLRGYTEEAQQAAEEALGN